MYIACDYLTVHGSGAGPLLSLTPVSNSFLIFEQFLISTNYELLLQNVVIISPFAIVIAHALESLANDF